MRSRPLAPPPEPTGVIVCEMKEGGHHFQVEHLCPPVQKGATTRYYRLWDNGSPAAGGQWHETVPDAIRRAGYVAQDTIAAKLRYAEAMWREMEHQNLSLRIQNDELKRKLREQREMVG